MINLYKKKKNDNNDNNGYNTTQIVNKNTC